MQSTHMAGFDAEALRAQILDNQIAVDALSYDTARALFVYEIDRTEADTCGEPTILDALLQRLDGTDMFDHAREVVPPERYNALVHQTTAPQPTRRMPLFKKNHPHRRRGDSAFFPRTDGLCVLPRTL